MQHAVPLIKRLHFCFIHISGKQDDVRCVPRVNLECNLLLAFHSHQSTKETMKHTPRSQHNTYYDN
jgi:hypothetical protein